MRQGNWDVERVKRSNAEVRKEVRKEVRQPSLSITKTQAPKLDLLFDAGQAV
jgi:hypothetical protein